MNDIPRHPPRRRRACCERDFGSGADRSRHDEFVTVERGQCSGVDVEQRHRLGHHRLEHRHRIELGREQAACSRELLRQGARAALRLEQPTAVERTPGGTRDLLRELEVVLREVTLRLEEHEHQAAVSGHRNREQRLERALPPVGLEPVVAEDAARREHLAVGRGLRQGAGQHECAHHLGQGVAADERETAGRGHEHRREIAAERLGRRLRRRVIRLGERQRLTEQRRNPIEAALDASLARPLGIALCVPQRE